MTLMPHHAQAIDRIVAHFSDNPDFLALLVGGSIAKGWARSDSDVDIVLVATDAVYVQRAATNQLHYYSRDFCDYQGGYVDGKIIDMAYLREVAARGSEPARSALVGAIVGFSRVADLDALLRQITTYPDATHQDKLESFYAQVLGMQWYVGEAEKRADRYLLLTMATDLVLFAARMILAHNKMLYPYHKWLLTALRDAPDRPADLLDRIEALLAEPGKTHADALCATVLGFADWPPPPEGWPARFMRDRELNWRNGLPPVADW